MPVYLISGESRGGRGPAPPLEMLNPGTPYETYMSHVFSCICYINITKKMF